MSRNQILDIFANSAANGEVIKEISQDDPINPKKILLRLACGTIVEHDIKSKDIQEFMSMRKVAMDYLREHLWKNQHSN